MELDGAGRAKQSGTELDGTGKSWIELASAGKDWMELDRAK